jgi:hypothetical protein
VIGLNEMTAVLEASVSVVDCWGKHGVYEQVGLRSATNGFCGIPFFVGCTDLGKHDVIDVYGVRYAGKGYFKVAFRSCGSPFCSVCVDAWASRESYKIEARLVEASKRLGLSVEHFIVSPSREDCDLPPKVLRGMAIKALKVRGFLGGVLILHAFRHGRFSLHFHFLGFLKNGYACRDCEFLKHSGRDLYCGVPAGSCSGFEQRTRKFNSSDGFIVKVAVDRDGNAFERVSVRSTSSYQLGHSSIVNEGKRSQVITWFGVCSYRNLKVAVLKHKDSCKICGGDLSEKVHCGSRVIVTDRDSPDFVGSFFDDLYDVDGSPNWLDAPSRSYGERG